MLILVFVFDYIGGEIFFEVFGSNVFYFVAISSIDAFICKYLMTADCGDRAKKYATLSFTSVCLHFIGSQMYLLDINMTFYVYCLWVIMIGKLMLLDKAFSDARKHIGHIASSFYCNMVFWYCHLANSARLEVVK